MRDTLRILIIGPTYASNQALSVPKRSISYGDAESLTVKTINDEFIKLHFGDNIFRNDVELIIGYICNIPTVEGAIVETMAADVVIAIDGWADTGKVPVLCMFIKEQIGKGLILIVSAMKELQPSPYRFTLNCEEQGYDIKETLKINDLAQLDTRNKGVQRTLKIQK